MTAKKELRTGTEDSRPAEPTGQVDRMIRELFAAIENHDTALIALLDRFNPVLMPEDSASPTTDSGEDNDELVELANLIWRANARVNALTSVIERAIMRSEL